MDFYTERLKNLKNHRCWDTGAVLNTLGKVIFVCYQYSPYKVEYEFFEERGPEYAAFINANKVVSIGTLKRKLDRKIKQMYNKVTIKRNHNEHT